MIPRAHFPTLLLIVGYPLYWLELYAWPHATGHTTWLATAAFVALAAWFLFRWKTEWVIPPLPKWFLFGGGACAGVIILVALAASLLPPHLPQEYDVINYHITLPRQHLIVGSFAHIPWSTADLYYSPLDYALAPFWLATVLPNKWPQLLFFFGVLLMVYRLARKAGASGQGGWLAAAAVLGCHAFVIQAGTAMLDIAICYCFLSAWDSLLENWPALAAIEFAFCFWAKSFMPLLSLAVLCGVLVLCFLLRGRIRASLLWKPQGFVFPVRQLLTVFVLVSVAVAGPFAVRSLTYGATPFYPLFAGKVSLFSPEGFGKSAVIEKAEEAMHSKDSYGLGRGPLPALQHFFVIAVPTEGVNNPFDYPLGLTYLLFAGPFLWAVLVALRQRAVTVEMVLVIVYWLLWWFGSQQSRFLFIPLALIFVIMAVEWKKTSAVVWSCVLVALVFEVLSMVRAHQADWGKTSWQVLRAQDRALVEQAKSVNRGDVVVTDQYDVAFAPFAVDVRNNSSEFVIRH